MRKERSVRSHQKMPGCAQYCKRKYAPPLSLWVVRLVDINGMCYSVCRIQGGASLRMPVDFSRDACLAELFDIQEETSGATWAAVAPVVSPLPLS